MPVSVACPYCRTTFAVGDPAAHRAVCPRCEETVPVRPVTGSETAAPATSPLEHRLTSPKWFKPALYASCVASVVILAVGLWWVFSEPKRPVTNPTNREPDGVGPPITLAGVGYLPGTVQLVAAVRPGPLGADPRLRLAELGLPKPILDALDRLGVPLSQIDHVAVGVTALPNNAIPQVVASLVLNRPPLDEDAVLKAVGAERVSGGNHPRYKATVGGVPVHTLRVSPTVYVFATEPKDLDAVGQNRPAMGDQFRPVLREEIMNRLSPASFAWAVAVGDDRWVDLPSIKLLASILKRDDLLTRFGTGRAMAVGLSLEPGPCLRVAVQAADERAVADWFGQQLAGEGTVVEKGGGWASVATPGPLPDVVDKLARLIPPLKK
jgi:hypothetical protein